MQEQEHYITKNVDIIKRRALFLENNGFDISNITEYTIEYSYKNICIIVYYGRYADAADVYVRFENNGLSKPEHYSIGWLRNMKKFELGEKNIFRKTDEKVDKLADIFSLLEYLKDNFDDITNIGFCRKTQSKINENFEIGIW